jgi:RNA polymerase sigma-70 factor (ECF subfamily)
MLSDQVNHALTDHLENLTIAAQAEADLVEAAHNDPAAFGELYRRYVVRIYRYLYSHVGAAETAEDLTAQVFCAVWEGITQYKEQGNFAAWLFRIARNKASDHFRRHRPSLPLDKAALLLSEEFDPQASLEKQEDLHRLSDLVARLPADQLELLRLRFAADLSFAQMAALLGRNEAAVKMSLYRLLDHFKSDWENCDE